MWRYVGVLLSEKKYGCPIKSRGTRRRHAQVNTFQHRKEVYTVPYYFTTHVSGSEHPPLPRWARCWRSTQKMTQKKQTLHAPFVRPEHCSTCPVSPWRNTLRKAVALGSSMPRSYLTPPHLCTRAAEKGSHSEISI